jgi:histidinol-phosphate aminotransferase
VNRYPDTAATALRERLAEVLGTAAGVDVGVDETVVGAGSTGVLQQILSSFCDPGDEVVFAWRSFEAYPILARLAGAVPVGVPLGADEGHDLDAMARAVTVRTRVVLLCTPNNPTGVPLDAAEVDAFLARIPGDVLVVIDEAYIEYSTAAGAVDSLALLRQHPNLCVLRTFSKAYGLAGLRVGYAVAAAPIAEGLRRTGLPFAVSALAQRAALASLEPAAAAEMRSRVAEVVVERSRMIAGLRSLGFTTPDSQANFVWLRMPDPAREALVDLFAENHILVRGYPGDGVRISLADAAATDRVLDVLARVAPGSDVLDHSQRAAFAGAGA